MRLEPTIAAVCLLVAHWATGQTNQAGANLSQVTPALPSEITLQDGRTYKSIALQRVEADGLLVTHIPDQGGLGMIKLKFTNLPERVQKQFDYSPEKAALQEQKQREATFQWVKWQAQEEERASQIRLERQIADAKLRLDNEAMEVHRARAEAKRKEAAAQQAQAEQAQAARERAQALRDWWDYGFNANYLK